MGWACSIHVGKLFTLFWMEMLITRSLPLERPSQKCQIILI